MQCRGGMLGIGIPTHRWPPSDLEQITSLSLSSSIPNMEQTIPTPLKGCDNENSRVQSSGNCAKS